MCLGIRWKKTSRSVPVQLENDFIFIASYPNMKRQWSEQLYKIKSMYCRIGAITGKKKTTLRSEVNTLREKSFSIEMFEEIQLVIKRFPLAFFRTCFWSRWLEWTRKKTSTLTWQNKEVWKKRYVAWNFLRSFDFGKTKPLSNVLQNGRNKTSTMMERKKDWRNQPEEVPFHWADRKRLARMVVRWSCP